MKTLTVEQRKNRSTWFISRILSAMLLVLIFQEPGLLAATGLVEIAVTWLLRSAMLWPLGFIVMCFGLKLGIITSPCSALDGFFVKVDKIGD